MGALATLTLTKFTCPGVFLCPKSLLGFSVKGPLFGGPWPLLTVVSARKWGWQAWPGEGYAAWH